MGVSVDEDGAPVAVIALCEGNVNGLLLYLDEDEDDFVKLAQLDATTPVKGSAEVPLASPGSEWTVRHPFEGVLEDATYDLGGWSENQDWSIRASFSQETLNGLKPGQVWWEKYDPEREVEVEMVDETAHFREHACDDWESSAGWMISW
ncbi:hypothetical protein [Kineosporia sp. NBRC 101731]|uniref:hypothetical protein n=1 Tax=Kineosporia sp. NBRC 101731 TaxID=3032199 RepID=UPI0024A0F7C5|nr:hypothetical protein [Kineosporia sp. NBRC 101731]GLY29371.1 hypothetical protein Kisp02_27360 [Kineosporia sp. NBRC 101731]